MVESKSNWFKKFIRERFRITFFHDDFKPLFSLRFTLFTFILWLIGYATIIIIITTFIIAKTSLKEYIPGYQSTKEKQQIIKLMLQMDSLQNTIDYQTQYLQSILKALKGENDSIKHIPKSTTYKQENTSSLKAQQRETNIRKEIEHTLFYNNRTVPYHTNNLPYSMMFLPPTQGIVIQQFNPSRGHIGIDIIGKEDEPIRSIDKGIVVYAGYTSQDGNFLIISHPNGIISVYKHLKYSIKNTGNYVLANEIIGAMGNTGIESKGIHLHFELWYQQKPINPYDYIQI